MDRSLFFLVLSITCVWLVIDAAVGKGYVNNFLTSIFPFMTKSDESEELTEEEVEEKSNNAPKSAAISGTSEKDIEEKFGNSRVWEYYENNTIPSAPALQAELETLKKQIANYKKTQGGK